MSSVVHNGEASGLPPLRPPRRNRIGAAIALGLTIFAFIVVACSGSGGQEDVGQQEQPICNPDEGCEPPPRDPCGTEGNPCCRFNGVLRCQTSLMCVDGICEGCGAPGQACCAGNVCQSNAACQNGTCQRTCGAQGLACCSTGAQCDSGLACAGGSCQPCGRGGQTCCAGNTCNGGFNCNNGTCNACGGIGQTCCASGAACGAGSSCISGVCRQDLCGTPGGLCCNVSSPSLKCQNSPSNYMCNETWNRCEPCGGSSGPCCAGGQCTFPSSYVCIGDGLFSTGMCRHCGSNGEPCCEGGISACSSGNVCGNGTCRSCGATGQPCCSGFSTACNSGNYCASGGTCQRCGGSGQPCCTSGVSCNYPLACSSGTCR
jgi:hypothetical protein